MAYKYTKFDRQLLAWLRSNPEKATTAQAAAFLKVSHSPTHIRHISRRFTQLEDRGVLKCTLRGTTRLCTVVGEIPNSITKELATSTPKRPPEPMAHDWHSVKASNSDEFLAAGGTIDKLPSSWDVRPIGSKPLGDSFSFDD